MVGLARDLGTRELYALCHTAHGASAQVLEKCGFVRQAVLPRHLEFPNPGSGGLDDCFRYVRHLD